MVCSYSASAQLPLNIQLRDDATFESYYPGDNKEAFAAVLQFSEGVGERFLYLFGADDVGRSHLLQAACHTARDLGVAAVYVPLSDADKLSPNLMQDLENIPMICMDDVHCIAGKREWEEALFHLYNRVRAQNTCLLLSANASPTQIPIELRDLKSRLSWGVAYQLYSLSDDQKLSALALRAKFRGLTLNRTVGKFLLNHCPRNMSEMFHTLEILDKASLTDQRRLTVPFVKQVLGI